MMAASLALVCVAAADSAAETVTRPTLSSVQLHRGGVAWVELAASAPVKNGRALLALPSRALAESIVVTVAPKGIKPTGWSMHALGSLDGPVDKAWAERRLHHEIALSMTDGSTMVGLVAGLQTGSLETGGDALLLQLTRGIEPTDDQVLAKALLKNIASIRFARPPMMRLHFTEAEGLAEVTLRMLVEGLGWEPEHHFSLGPDGRGMMSLRVMARNAGPESIATRSASAAFALPLIPGRSSDRAMPMAPALPLGPLTLAAGEAMRFPVGEHEIETLWVHDCLIETIGVGQQHWSDAQEPTRVKLRLKNATPQYWPAGPCLVTGATGPRGLCELPETAGGAMAELDLGTSATVFFRRQETELERKSSDVRQENEEYNWIYLTGTLEIENRGPAPAEVRVRRVFEGEGIAASGNGVMQRTPNRVGRFGPVCEVRWTATIAPGSVTKLTYGYKTHAPTR